MKRKEDSHRSACFRYLPFPFSPLANSGQIKQTKHGIKILLGLNWGVSARCGVVDKTGLLYKVSLSVGGVVRAVNRSFYLLEKLFTAVATSSGVYFEIADRNVVEGMGWT